MNINRKIGNRALGRVGQGQIFESDTTSNSWLLLKKYYLSTMLESLAEVPWTSAKKRVYLAESTDPNLSDYSYTYQLPIDCAKPLELQNNEYYIIEGTTLFTNTAKAMLLYITNGRLAAAAYKTEDDYPDYDPPIFEDLFYEYLEVRIASKMALELAGKMDLYQILYNEATMIGTAASKASKASSAAKKNGQRFWVDEIRGR